MAKKKVTERSVIRAQRKLDRRYEMLELWQYALEEILTGGDQSYTIGGRQVNRRSYTADQCRDEIRRLEEEIDDLEDLIDGYRPRSAKRVLIRDI